MKFQVLEIESNFHRGNFAYCNHGFQLQRLIKSLIANQKFKLQSTYDLKFNVKRSRVFYFEYVVRRYIIVKNQIVVDKKDWK